jgi:hypothetical protein
MVGSTRSTRLRTSTRSLITLALSLGLFVASGHAQGNKLSANQNERQTTTTSTTGDEKPASRSARDIRGASPYVAVEKEPAPKLIVDDPLPEGLALGVFWAQYRVENLRIVPVFGAGALQVSPRVGHLHITVDDLPWWWADASDNNTVDIAGLPPGQHKVKIELVDANHNVFPGQFRTVTFTIPKGASLSHSH